jgi:hypothetical protein
VTADGPGGQGPVLRALAVGGLAQILVASLAYLGPVLRGGGHERLTQGFALTRSWPGLALANVAAACLGGVVVAARPAGARRLGARHRGARDPARG